MKLGTQTGSVINHLHSRATRGQPLPEVGLGVTLLHWTDRSPGTIQNVFEEGKYLYIAVTDDDFKRTDKNGISERQTYDYTPRPDGVPSFYRRPCDDPNAPFTGVRKNTQTGRWNKNGNAIRIGVREKYEDPCF